MEPERMQESDQTNVKLGEENFAESTNPKLRILKYRKTVPQLSIEWDNFPKKTLRLLWDWNTTNFDNKAEPSSNGKVEETFDNDDFSIDMSVITSTKNNVEADDVNWVIMRL